jgi:gluconolactonase
MKPAAQKRLPALLFLILSVCVNACAQSPAFDTDSIIAPGATLQKIPGHFSFTEGASVDRHGNVFFTDQPNDKIWEYSAEGVLSLFMDSTGRSNGMYFDKKGWLVSCAPAKKLKCW